MADYITTNIRNIALIGHGSEGKTTLTERMLALCGAFKTAGSVDGGTAHTDTLGVERARGISVRSSAARDCKCVRRFFLFIAKKPSKVNRPVGSPDTARAVTRAQGPGMATTGISARAQLCTSSSPGSLMAGVPASVTSAQLSPAMRRPKIASPLVSALCR